jgi:hypothetical protein
MAKSTLSRYELPGNILVVHVSDTSPETVQDWYASSVVEMNGYSEPVKRLYDMRDLNSLSIEAVRTAVKLRRHPNAKFAYTAVLTNNNTVLALVRASLSVQGDGNIKLFTDEAQAIAWLHEKVP